MKAKVTICSKCVGMFGMALAASLLWASWAALAAPPKEPAITSIQLDATNVVVTVSVPAGITKVTLEGRSRVVGGAWEPRAVLRVDNSKDGSVTFRLAKAANLEILRVRADATEALPAAFYQGTNSFNGPASSSGDAALATGGLTPNGTGVTSTPIAAADSTTARPVVESDIWKIQDDTLYFFNQYRGLQVIDIHNPDHSVIRGTLPLPAAGEQMYLLGTNYAVLLAHGGCDWYGSSAQSQLMVVAVDRATPVVVASLPMDGYILESRQVGTAFYVASQAYRKLSTASGATDQWEWGTLVSSFDLSDPAHPVAKNSQWVSGYGSVVTATDEFFFISTQDPNNWQKSIVWLLDISAPDGSMSLVSTIRPAGQVPDKFKINLDENILTIISEDWTTTLVTRLETFDLTTPQQPKKLAQLDLGRQERLNATRFDGKRVYVVTFFVQISRDPLFIVDLTNPAKPTIQGSLEIPGYSTYIQPFGDRLVAVGIETNRTTVSLFDVHDGTKPALLSRIPLGSQWSWAEANSDEKAFSVLPEAGLILIPFSGYDTNSYIQRLQLIDLNADSLVQRGYIDHDITPRRATLVGNRIVSISGQELLSVDATDRDHPQVTGDLELAWTVSRVFDAGDYLIELSNYGLSGSLGPSLRVVSKGAPDVTLSRLALTNLNVLGGGVKDGKLYLLQGQSAYINWLQQTNIISGDPTNKDTNVVQWITQTNSGTLDLKVFDLASLPVLNLTAEVQTTTDSMFYGELQPLWPQANLLVWAGSAGNYFYPLAYDAGVGIAPTAGNLSSSVAFFRYPYYGGGSGYLIAYQTGGTPKLVSETNLTGTNQWWSFSRSFATTNGLVYLSHQSSVYYPDIIPPWQPLPDPILTTNRSGGVTTNQTPLVPWGIWVSKYWLDVVDFADPTLPTVRQPVSISGTLQGISDAGALVYTDGYHYNSTNWNNDGTEYIDALAYDGVSAALVDSLPLPSEWPRTYLVNDGLIYLARLDGTNAASVVETYAISKQLGKFTRFQSGAPTKMISELAFVRDALVARVDSSVLVLNPGTLNAVTEGHTPGCLWFDLQHADGSLTGGIWLPLNDYGVMMVK